jgi:hypothetical protein
MKYALSVYSLVLAAGLFLPYSAPAETFTPRRAADVQESIGVVVHFNYTDGAYARPDEAVKDLAYLGVTHLRDRTPEMDTKYPEARHPYIDIMKQGYSFNFLARGGDFTPVDTIAPLTQLERAAPGMIDSIEGFNEVDHDGVSYRGVKGPQGAVAAQSALYAGIRADPVLGHLPVYDLTGVPWPQPNEKRADFLNSHLYAQNGNPPGFWFDEAADKALKRGMPLVVTEFGYASMPESGWLVIGVDKRTQAKGILLGLFQAFSRNVERTYIYELLDEKPDPLMNEREFHFGLFDYDYRPKTSAKAIHNLTAILKDTSAASRTFTPLSLDIDVDHFPEALRGMVIAKADGTLYLTMWNDVAFWDRAAGKPVESKPVTVTLPLPGGLKAQALYDPLESAKAVRTYNGETTITLDVPDHPVMLEVRP